MILCIDTTMLECAYEVQKQLKLEDLLLNHTKYFDSVEEALKEKYVPLDFATTIRTTFSNKVLEIDAENGNHLYYENLSDIGVVIHKGYDLVMHLSSVSLMNQIKAIDPTFIDIMVNSSTIQCCGILNTAPEIINPIVYSQIIFSDECVETLSTYFKEGRRLIDIKDINPKGNLPMLLNEIVEVNNE